MRFTQITKRGHMGGEQSLGPVRLIHKNSKRYLHSHTKNLRSKFNEVIVIDQRDENNVWMLTDVAQSSARSQDGHDIIHYGDVIRVKHKETGQMLHSHGEERQQGNQYEVVTFGKTPDENDSWIVMPPADAPNDGAGYVHTHTHTHTHTDRISPPLPLPPSPISPSHLRPLILSPVLAELISQNNCACACPLRWSLRSCVATEWPREKVSWLP